MSYFMSFYNASVLIGGWCYWTNGSILESLPGQVKLGYLGIASKIERKGK